MSFFLDIRFDCGRIRTPGRMENNPIAPPSERQHRANAAMKSSTFSLSLVLAAALLWTPEAQSQLIITSITASVIDLDRYAENPSGNPPDTYVEGPGQDEVIYAANGTQFTSITAALSTIVTTEVNPGDWTDTTSGGSTITLTGLNSNGDNWGGFATNTNNAATLNNSDSMTIDFALLGLNQAGTFELTVVPEPSAFLFLGLVGVTVAGGHWIRKRRSSPA